MNEKAQRIIDTYGRETPIDDLALTLFETWCKVDPNSDPAQYPSSYMANFADMARAVMVWNKENYRPDREWIENVEYLLSNGDPDVVRCHEGGGSESLVGSLVLTMMRTRNSRDKIKQKGWLESQIEKGNYPQYFKID